MACGLKTYPEYKDSGLPWMGLVPTHWSLLRGKYLFRHHKRINSDGLHNNVLSLTLRGVVNNDPDNPEGLVPKDYATYQLFGKGDLVFKLIDLENLRTSRVGLVHEDGIMSSAYLRLIPNDPALVRYFFYQFFDLYLRGVYNKLGAGVRATLGAGDLLNLCLCVPPHDEQANIVHYLEHQTRKIAHFIRNKERLIDLLQEQKQAIINRAVTRGIDPDVRLKPSGIDWLGEIPEHWGVKKLKYLFKEVDERSTTGEETLLSLRMVEGLIPHDEVSERPIKPSDVIGYKITMSGQLVMNRMRAATGLFGITPSLGIVSPDYAIFDAVSSINLTYFLRLFKLPAVQLEFRLESRGLGTGSSGFLRLYSDRFGRIPVPIPPLEEQDQIVESIQQSDAHFDTAIQSTQREIKLIREYRTRLIADVVTGKVDVRDIPVEDVPEGEALEEFVESQEMEEALDIGEIQDAKQ